MQKSYASSIGYMSVSKVSIYFDQLQASATYDADELVRLVLVMDELVVCACVLVVEVVEVVLVRCCVVVVEDVVG